MSGLSAAKRVFIIAAEPSGDAVAADFIAALRETAPDMVFAGMGGPKMAALGVTSCTPIDGLSILGLTEALKIWKLVREKVRLVAQAACAFQPDAVVLIDSWGFTVRAAQQIRKLLPGVPLIKMIGPQVFAARPGRVKSVAKNYDALFCIHDFEVPYYDGLDIPITVIGNPAVSRAQIGDEAAFRARHNLTHNECIALLLPGSRPAEIDLVSPTFEEAARRLQQEFRELVFVVVLVPAVADQIRKRAQHWTFRHILVDETEKADAFKAGTLALACSGTVTTDLALQGTPMIVGYRLGSLTAFIMLNFMMKTRFVTLVNIALDQEIVPEFLQDKFTPEAVVIEARKLLTGSDAQYRQIKLLNQALSKMGRDDPPMAQRAAKALLDLLQHNDANV